VHITNQIFLQIDLIELGEQVGLTGMSPEFEDIRMVSELLAEDIDARIPEEVWRERMAVLRAPNPPIPGRLSPVLEESPVVSSPAAQQEMEAQPNPGTIGGASDGGSTTACQSGSPAAAGATGV